LKKEKMNSETSSSATVDGIVFVPDAKRVKVDTTTTVVASVDKDTDASGSSSSKVKASRHPSTALCWCEVPLEVRNTSKGEVIGCGASVWNSELKKYDNGCKLFIWMHEWDASSVCAQHNVAKCQNCNKQLHPEVLTFLRRDIKCYCGKKASVRRTQSKPVNFTFLSCGSAHKDAVTGVWKNDCPFWAKAASYDKLKPCKTCKQKLTRMPCWSCQQAKRK
jgi:hypothetical protein